jgi:flagellar hook protein FlgE
MIKSLYEGVSGLNANALAMGVIGDNIANVKTFGFKAGTVSFAELLSQSIESGGTGNGVGVWDISNSWNQGSAENTGSVMDFAIDGDGFFMVRDDAGITRYTRAGLFQMDPAGDLVNPDGLKVQGKKVIDPETGVLGNIEAINISSENAPAAATDELSMILNLDAEAIADAAYSTSMMVYDALATPIELDFLFTPTLDGTGSSIPGRWNWQVSVDPSVTDTPVSSGGELAFDAAGLLDPAACIPAGGIPTIDITDLKSGAGPLSIEWRYLKEGAAGLESDGSITGDADRSEVTGQVQNGYPEGELQRVSVDEKGIISGVYSNGNITPLYQITLANFTNNQGLIGKGNNLFGQSAASGLPTLGEPSTGPFGGIVSGALEQSNVDLNAEFVSLITTQRAFQANSKVITTSDELLLELMKLKR